MSASAEASAEALTEASDPGPVPDEGRVSQAEAAIVLGNAGTSLGYLHMAMIALERHAQAGGYADTRTRHAIVRTAEELVVCAEEFARGVR